MTKYVIMLSLNDQIHIMHHFKISSYNSNLFIVIDQRLSGICSQDHTFHIIETCVFHNVKTVFDLEKKFVIILIL